MLKHRLYQSTRTNLYLQFQMKRALKVLEMPYLELKEYLYDQIEKNPAIEYELPLIGSSENLDTISSDHPIFTDSLEFEGKVASSNKKEKALFDYLIRSMDSNGFLEKSFHELSKDTGSSLKEIKNAQKKLQSLLGCCTKNLKDHLLLHLKKKQKTASLCFDLLENDFESLINGSWSYLKKVYGLDQAEILSLLKQEFCCLELNRADTFINSHNEIQTVDVVYQKDGSKWSIELNRLDLPKISLSKIKGLSTFLMHAKQLIQHLNFRDQNLLKLAEYFLNKQMPFFDDDGPFNPIILKECAEKLDMHPSTISRIIQSKSFSCPRGTFAFKNGFSNTSFKNKQITKNTFEEILIKLVDQENKTHPFTDKQLEEMLHKMNIPCARRTITKYRKKLRISSARKRKALS